MPTIFISYRREDAEGQAGRLFNDLAEQFGEHSVFMDVAGIEPGRDFRRAIDEQVASCGVVPAVIGKRWLDAKDESGRRRSTDNNVTALQFNCDNDLSRRWTIRLKK